MSKERLGCSRASVGNHRRGLVPMAQSSARRGMAFDELGRAATTACAASRVASVTSGRRRSRIVVRAAGGRAMVDASGRHAWPLRTERRATSSRACCAGSLLAGRAIVASATAWTVANGSAAGAGALVQGLASRCRSRRGAASTGGGIMMSASTRSSCGFLVDARPGRLLAPRDLPVDPTWPLSPH